MNKNAEFVRDKARLFYTKAIKLGVMDPSQEESYDKVYGAPKLGELLLKQLRYFDSDLNGQIRAAMEPKDARELRGEIVAKLGRLSLTSKPTQ